MYGPSQGKYHHQGYYQLCPGGNSQCKGSGDWIVEKGLEQIAGQSQAAPKDGCRQSAGKAYGHYDILKDFICFPAQKDARDLP